jgi:hypothetical protein
VSRQANVSEPTDVAIATRQRRSWHQPQRSPSAQRRARRVYLALECISFAHSCIYTALLVCAFAAGKPQPETFVFGLTHGLLWIFMSLACIAAARARIVPLRLAVAVAVLGGIGPFFGSAEFLRMQRKGQAPASA